MRRYVCYATVLCAATLAGGCQVSASGVALQNKLGHSLHRLSQGTQQWVSSEMPRARRFVETAQTPSLGLANATSKLVTTIEHTSASMASTLRRLPAAIPTPSTPLLHRASKDLHGLLRTEHARPPIGSVLYGWRESLEQVPRILQMDRPILSGPGDLDRTVDPHQARRELTWTERLLRRF